jgi:uncharacterized protein YajQ (UPF0234 family)
MADTQSFDITSGCDLQEVDNALNQARKEVAQRFDFRGLKIDLEFDRKENRIVLSAPDEHRARAVYDVLMGKLAKRGVPIRNLRPKDPVPAAGSSVRQEILLQQGISDDAAKAIVKYVKDLKLKKVQASIQGDQVRVSSPSRDALQEAIGILKAHDFGIELSFGNYRG